MNEIEAGNFKELVDFFTEFSTPRPPEEIGFTTEQLSLMASRGLVYEGNDGKGVLVRIMPDSVTKRFADLRRAQYYDDAEELEFFASVRTDDDESFRYRWSELF